MLVSASLIVLERIPDQLLGLHNHLLSPFFFGFLRVGEEFFLFKLSEIVDQLKVYILHWGV